MITKFKKNIALAVVLTSSMLFSVNAYASKVEVGDKVIIKEGALRGIDGTVRRVHLDQGKEKVSLTVIVSGNEKNIQLDIGKVEKINK